MKNLSLAFQAVTVPLSIPLSIPYTYGSSIDKGIENWTKYSLGIVRLDIQAYTLSTEDFQAFGIRLYKISW